MHNKKNISIEYIHIILDSCIKSLHSSIFMLEIKTQVFHYRDILKDINNKDNNKQLKVIIKNKNIIKIIHKK